MKKMFLVLMLLLLTTAAAMAETGWIARSALTEEEWRLLELLDMIDDGGYNGGPYDFKAPAGAKYITLMAWELQEGQWTELGRNDAELPETQPPQELKLTLRQQADGSWQADVAQQKTEDEQPDGRIFINAPDIVNRCWLSIQTRETLRQRGFTREEPVDTDDLYFRGRTFLEPGPTSRLQERVDAALDEQVVLHLYAYSPDWTLGIPAISSFGDPEAFADYERAYAITVIFTAAPLEK